MVLTTKYYEIPFNSEAKKAVLTAINLTVGFPIKRLEVLSITEYRGAGLMGKGGHLNPISLYKKKIIQKHI